jgi:branched-chain amino acid transport system permease protein
MSDIPASRVGGVTARRSMRLDGHLASVGGHAAVLLAAVGLGYLLDPVNSRLVMVTMIYSIAVIGLNITLGYCGLVSLAQAGFLGLGAYTWTLVSARSGLGFLPAAVIAIAVCAALGFLVGALATRVKTHYFIIVTIGLQITFVTLLGRWSSLTGGTQGMVVQSDLRLGPLTVTSLQGLLTVIAGVFVIMLYLANRLRRSRDGRAMLALLQSGPGAEASGVNAWMYRSIGMAVGAGYGGVAGCLFAPYLRFLGPESFGLELSILFVVMLVVGGLGSNVGAVLGVAVLTQIDHYAQSTLGLSNLIYGGVLVFAVVAAPKGIVGMLRIGAAWVRKRVAAGDGGNSK